MIKIKTIILFLFISINSFSQFNPIISSDSVSWHIIHEVWDGTVSDNLSLGDTISIDSIIYNRVNSYSQTIGYFREDTNSGRAWFMEKDSSEHLIMDLSLQINDTFLVKMYADTNVTVASIDTINGRRILTLNYKYGGGFISENLKFIEGVGPNAALFYQVNDKGDFFEGDYLFGHLVCRMYHDSSIVYAWDTINFGCGQTGIGIEESIQKNRIEVYPNPTSSIVKFNFTDQSLLNKSLIIFNTKGEQILNIKIDSSEIEINLIKFPNQTFFYGIVGAKYQSKGKIIKK